MPLSVEHKQQTRSKIIEAARILFNRHGFAGVTIEMVMQSAGLTRGGFYNHFKTKQELYSEAVTSFLMGRGLKWRMDAGIDPTCPTTEMAQQMVQSYLSPEHLEDIDGQCPMIALPSDVARAGEEVQSSYQELLQAMVWLFETSIGQAVPEALSKAEARQKSLSLAALCVGGMVLARTLPNSDLAEEVRQAANQTATKMASL